MTIDKTIHVIVLSQEAAWRVMGALDKALASRPTDPMYKKALMDMRRAVPSPIWVEEEIIDDE